MQLPRYISLRKIFFLVRDPLSRSTYWTQFFKPDVKPLKVYYQDKDVTSFLTGCTHLTNFTYLLLAENAAHLGLNSVDVRNYIRVTLRIGRNKKVEESHKNKLLPSQSTLSQTLKVTSNNLRKRRLAGTVPSQDTQPVKRMTTEADHQLEKESSSPSKLESIQFRSAGLLPRVEEVRREAVPSVASPSSFHAVPLDYGKEQRVLKFGNSPKSVENVFLLLMAELIPGLRLPKPKIMYRVNLMYDGFGNDAFQEMIEYLRRKDSPLLRPGGIYETAVELVSYYGQRLPSRRDLVHQLTFDQSNEFRAYTLEEFITYYNLSPGELRVDNV